MLRGVSLLWALLLPAGFAASGCRAPGARLRAFVSDPFAPPVPDISAWGGKVWFAERTQAYSAYALELARPLPLQFQTRRTVRFLVLSGRIAARVGGRERSLGAGSFLSIPRGTAYRILPAAGRARLLMLLTPDGSDSVIVEMPRIARRLSTPLSGTIIPHSHLQKGTLKIDAALEKTPRYDLRPIADRVFGVSRLRRSIQGHGTDPGRSALGGPDPSDAPF